MDPNRFLKETLGGFDALIFDAASPTIQLKWLVSLPYYKFHRDSEMTLAIYTIVPKYPFPLSKIYSVISFNEELWAMKQVGQ